MYRGCLARCSSASAFEALAFFCPVLPPTFFADMSVLALGRFGFAYSPVPSVARVFAAEIRFALGFTLTGVSGADRIEPVQTEVIEAGDVCEEEISTFADTDSDGFVEHDNIGLVLDGCSGEESKDVLRVGREL